MPVAGSGKARPTPLSGAHAGSIRHVAAQRIALPATSAQRAIGAALLIVSQAGPELALGDRNREQPHSRRARCRRGALPKGTRWVRAHVTPSGGGGLVRRAERDAHQQICPWLSRVIRPRYQAFVKREVGRAGLKAGANLVTSDLRRQAEVTVMIGCESICGKDRATVDRQTLRVIRGL